MTFKFERFFVFELKLTINVSLCPRAILRINDKLQLCHVVQFGKKLYKKISEASLDEAIGRIQFYTVRGILRAQTALEINARTLAKFIYFLCTLRVRIMYVSKT